MTDQSIHSQFQSENDDAAPGITLHDVIRMVIDNWYWFVLSAFLCLGIAYYYLASTPKVYSRTATILVKDSRKGGDVELQAFSDLAGFQSRRNVDNEIFILQSRRLMSEVVKRLNLTVNYIVRERLRDRALYGQSPIEVTFLNENSNQSLSLEIVPEEDNRIRLSKFDDLYVTKQESRSVVTAQYGDTIATPVGQIIVKKTPYMNADYTGTPIRVTKGSLPGTTNAYRNAVKCDVANKQASVVTVSMSNSVPKRAEDVINTLIMAYNDDAVEDKRRISVLTANFIKARLDVIGRELGDVDRNIEGIKKDNQMIDITSEAARSVSESSRYKAEGLSLDNQINVAGFIHNYLTDAANAGELIPMITPVDNNAVTTQIEKYNNVILRREKLMENSSKNSPVIQDLDNVLSSLRRSIIAALESHVSTLEIQRASMRKEEDQANRRISTMPSQEKVILGITRQQKIKEELFLYLLNKQEETQLNFAIAEPNSRIIDTAYGSPYPVSPRPLIILGVALIAGLAIPFGLLFLIGMLDTTIRSRKDIENNISAPFLGDIPVYDGEVKSGVVVRETGRDPLSEAFRILRSNMTFMNVSAGTAVQSVLFTSSDPHAGKTFVAMNLATTLAMAGKRVLLIDLDLRRHALSSQLGHPNSKKGITSYIAGTIADPAELIFNPGIHKNLDVILSGVQPPNPTEMLLSEKLDKLIADLRGKYDYLFIDSTPAMSVADAIITDRLSDLCLYIVREGVLDRRQLPDIERLHREKKLHNMCIVLNGTRTRRHSYGYGYGYGYSYGYGYDYDDNKKETSYRKRLVSFLRKYTGKIKH